MIILGLQLSEIYPKLLVSALPPNKNPGLVLGLNDLIEVLYFRHGSDRNRGAATHRG